MIAGMPVTRPINPSIFEPNAPAFTIKTKLTSIEISAKRIASKDLIIVGRRRFVLINVRPSASGPPMTTNASKNATR